MGCDAYADENGELYIEIRTWTIKRKIPVHITGLEPNEKIYIEYLKGEQR